MLKNLSITDNENYIYRYDPRIILFEKNINGINIIFKTNSSSYHHKYIPKIKIKSGMRPVPPLLWKFNTNYQTETLSINAFKQYNDDKTVLYRAPFLNTSSTVCLGSSEFDVNVFHRGNATEIADSIINSFFNSAFTHASHSKQTVGNIITLSHKLLDMDEFPMDQLMPISSPIITSEDEDD